MSESSCLCGSSAIRGVCCRSGQKVEPKPEPVEDLEDDCHQPGAPKQPADVCRHQWEKISREEVACSAGCGAVLLLTEFIENACYVQGDC
jgi:hypothetical protein